MDLMDELVTAYLHNDFEVSYYLDLQTASVILEMDEMYTGEPGIDWDDDENIERYMDIPKIDSNEAFLIMTKFAKSTQSDPQEKLFDALDGRKPFRRFKDVLYELGLWDEWNEFEYNFVKEELQYWMVHKGLDYNELNEKYKEHHT